MGRRQMIPIGSVLIGTTRRHAGKIRVIGITPQSYKIEKIGRRDGKLKRFVARSVIEMQYQFVNKERRTNAAG